MAGIPDMILTGRAVDAGEAYAMGLANRVVLKGKALEEATRLARPENLHTAYSISTLE